MDSEYKKGGAYELPEAGSFPARLTSIIEIGTVKTPFFQKGSFKEGEAPKLNAETGQFEDNRGQVTDAEGYLLGADGGKMLKYAHQVSLNFEGQNDGKRFYIKSKDLTLSLNEKAVLFKYLKEILGREIVEGDKPRTLLQEALGKSCIVSVAHVKVGDKTYANLSNVAAPMKGVNVLEAKAELTFLNFKDWDQAVFEKLPEFVKGKITQSHEYQNMVANLQRKGNEILPTGQRVSEANANNGEVDEVPTTWTDENGKVHTIPF